jgi:hypothetical protein
VRYTYIEQAMGMEGQALMMLYTTVFCVLRFFARLVHASGFSAWDMF